jgi:hypothetical protein
VKPECGTGTREKRWFFAWRRSTFILDGPCEVRSPMMQLLPRKIVFSWLFLATSVAQSRISIASPNHFIPSFHALRSPGRIVQSLQDDRINFGLLGSALSFSAADPADVMIGHVLP